MKGNFTNMDPPIGPPHEEPATFDNDFPPLNFQGEVYERARICVYRGVSFMFTHFRSSGNAQIPANERIPPFLVNWVTTIQAIASLLNDDDPTPSGDPIQQDPADMPAAINAWEQAGGYSQLAIPVEFPAAIVPG